MIVERRYLRQPDPVPPAVPSIWVALANEVFTSHDSIAAVELARMVLEASETRTVRAPR